MVAAMYRRSAVKMNNANCFRKTENNIFIIGGEVLGLHVSFYVLYLGPHYMVCKVRVDSGAHFFV